MITTPPQLVGWVTLAAGAGLVAAPRLTAGPLGLGGGDHAALRALGAADLVLVPGLLRGEPRWPWMAARAALNVGQAAVLLRLGRRSTAPKAVWATAAALAGLTAVDVPTALALRRSGD
jgi:hypothetical protein